MQTAEAKDVDNEQFGEVSLMELNQFARIESQYPFRNECSAPTARFNCHGMTFASRRTGIYESAALLQILREDGYTEILPNEVLPGDVVIYHSEDGDFEHSGVIVTAPTQESLFVATVRSKWGKFKEVIHLANRCPYDSSSLKYYRVRT